MKWYLAKIIFQIVVSDETKSQFDIQLRLLLDHTIDKAYSQAKQIGKDEEETFTSSNNKTVQWKFIDVESISELSELNNGTLIHSFTHEEKSANDFIKSVKRKSKYITEKHADTFVTS